MSDSARCYELGYPISKFCGCVWIRIEDGGGKRYMDDIGSSVTASATSSTITTYDILLNPASSLAVPRIRSLTCPFPTVSHGSVGGCTGHRHALIYSPMNGNISQLFNATRDPIRM